MLFATTPRHSIFTSGNLYLGHVFTGAPISRNSLSKNKTNRRWQSAHGAETMAAVPSANILAQPPTRVPCSLSTIVTTAVWSLYYLLTEFSLVAATLIRRNHQERLQKHDLSLQTIPTPRCLPSLPPPYSRGSTRNPLTRQIPLARPQHHNRMADAPRWNYHDTVNASWISNYKSPYLHLWCGAPDLN